MAKTATSRISPPIIENIPEELTERPQWVCWCLEERDGKATKVPYTPATERRASTTDLLTWRTFSEALDAYEAGEPPYDGIGFVFTAHDPFCGVDLDSCVDLKPREIEPWAQRIVEAFADEGYVEASPSGTGIHIIIKGALEECAKTKHVEIYHQRRFFTITGRML